MRANGGFLSGLPDRATAGRASARWPPSTTRGLVSPPVRIPLLFGDNVPLETMACHLKRRAFHTVPGIERGTAVSKGLGFTTAPYGSPTCDGGEEPFGNVRNICWFAFNEQSSADVRVSSSSFRF